MAEIRLIEHHFGPPKKAEEPSVEDSKVIEKELEEVEAFQKSTEAHLQEHFNDFSKKKTKSIPNFTPIDRYNDSMFDLVTNDAVDYKRRLITNGPFRRSENKPFRDGYYKPMSFGGTGLWKDITIPSSFYSKPSDNGFFKLEKEYVLVCFRDALSKDKEALDKFIENYCRMFAVIRTRKCPYKRRVLKLIAKEVLPYPDKPNYEKMPELALALRGHVAPNMLKVMNDYYMEPFEINPDIKSLWDGGNDYVAFITKNVNKNTSGAVVESLAKSLKKEMAFEKERLKTETRADEIKKENEENMKTDEIKKDSVQDIILAYKTLAKFATENGKSIGMSEADLANLVDAVEPFTVPATNAKRLLDESPVFTDVSSPEVINRFAKDIEAVETKADSLAHKERRETLLNVAKQFIQDKKDKEAEVDEVKGETMDRILDKELEEFLNERDVTVKLDEFSKRSRDTIYDVVCHNTVKRDGKIVPNSNERAKLEISILESALRNNSDYALELLSKFRKQSGTGHQNVPVSRGGVSVKELNERAKKDAEAIAKIKESAERINSIAAGVKHEDDLSWEETLSVLKEEASTPSPLVTKTLTWKSDPKWFESFDAYAEDKKKQTKNTDNKDDKKYYYMVADTESDVAAAYAQLLKSRRAFILAKKKLNAQYKSLGVDELTDELE